MSEDIDNFMPYLEEVASKSAIIIEIGVGKGTGSTLAFDRGLSRSQRNPPVLHVSVDHQDYMDVKPSSTRWHFVLGDSRSPETYGKVDAILKGGRYPVDLVYIDTDHTPIQIKPELLLWQNIVEPSTVWLFHDTYMMGEYNPMTDAIKEFAAKNGWQYEDVFTEAHGLGRMFR